MRLTDLPLDRPIATIMVLVALTVLGGVAVFLIPLDFMPEVREPEIDVTVPFPGSHPLEGLRRVVRPIEEEISSIPEVTAVFGFSSPGQVTIETQFDWSVDIELKEMEVREAVERARSRLPDGLGHITVEGDTDGPGAQVLGGRISANRDLAESWDLLDRRIRRPLERVRGVARVDLLGVEPQEVRIDLDLDALSRHGIRVGDLIDRINSSNVDLDLGAVRGDVLRYEVRSRARFRDVAQLQELVVDDGDLRLRDVAVVGLREPILNYGRHLNRKFAIGFEVFKESSANTVDTVQQLTARLDQIRADPQLEGIDVLVWDNAAEEILNSLFGLRNAGIFGGILAISVLYFFLRRGSTTLIIAVAIPFSLLVTCGAMLVFGFVFNVLTMLGLMLGVGMLVDNAVVVLENIHRLQGQGLDPASAARAGSRQVALAVTAATATTLIVWSWLFIVERSELTIYIGEVAMVICLAVSCSLLISLTLIPLAAARFVPHRVVAPGFFDRKLIPRYRGVLAWTLRHRFLTLICLVGLAASVVIPLSQIEISGEPRKRERDVSIRYQIHDASTKEVMETYVDTVEAWIESRREELQYENLYSVYTEDPYAATRVYLSSAGTTEKKLAALRRALRDGLPVIPGVELTVGDGGDRHGRGPTRKASVSVSVHGDDPEYLQELAAEIEARARRLPDVVEVYGPSLEGRKEARIVIDAERARTLGLTPRRAADAVAFAFRGQRLRRFEGERGEIEVILGLPEDARPGLSAITNLELPTDRGTTVRLGAFAEVEIARTPPQIVRINRKTSQNVTIEFDDAEVTSDEGRERVAAEMALLQLPDGYSWDWSRNMRRGDDAMGVMLRGVLLSLALVVILMVALFESFTQPLAILITLPLAFFGLFWALWIFGLVFEPVAFIGLIILIGIVVNNGIVMVEHVNSLRRSGTAREEALLEGCGDRLRPVLMTVITTVVGLLPLAFSAFTVAGVYVDSIAVGMIGGLLSSSIFTLIALPVWYATVEDGGAVLAGLLPRRLLGKARTVSN